VQAGIPFQASRLTAPLRITVENVKKQHKEAFDGLFDEAVEDI
jgi:hypothetical protein